MGPHPIPQQPLIGIEDITAYPDPLDVQNLGAVVLALERFAR
jgi:hypothetical protein